MNVAFIIGSYFDLGICWETNMKSTVVRTILALVSTVVFSSLTYAKPFHLEIDFRDPAVWGGHGSPSFSNGGVTVDANGDLLFRDNQDGYGILGGTEWDEIDRGEVLTVWFDAEFFKETTNLLTGVLLTDLFSANDGGDSGWVTLWFGDDFVEFFVQAIDWVRNGEYYVDFDGAFAPDKIVFTAYLGPDGQHSGSNDYSVAGFTTVPEPATLLLLGVGLIAIGMRRRQRVQGIAA